MSQPPLRYLTHWLLSARGRHRLQVIEYDDSLKRIIKAVPFERECESTVFVNGTIAVVSDDMPDNVTDPTPYLADISDSPVRLVRI